MSRNFHVVSMCSSGNGGWAGKNALRARCSSTEESLPIEYSTTGRAAWRGDFAQDVDALGFERLQMCGWVGHVSSFRAGWVCAWSSVSR